MRRVNAKFVPRLLTDDQKENLFEIRQELLAKANGYENYLKNIITGKKRWFMGMMLKQRCNRRSGWRNGIIDLKKARMSRSKFKVMLVVFFDWKGIVNHEFVPRGQMVNKQLYQEVLTRLRDAVLGKRHELWENQTWMLHHDNAPAHASLLIRNYLAKHQTAVVPRPPDSPDLAPAYLDYKAGQSSESAETGYSTKL